MRDTVTTCKYGGGRFEISEFGVWFIGHKDGNDQPPKWICAPLHIIAKTRDEKSGEWGRLLAWNDDDGKEHQWAMPLELLEGDGSEVRRELARLGLHISPNQTERNLLQAYIKVWPVEIRARCVERLGWHGNVFVMPSESIGTATELIVFQNAHAIEHAYSESGSVEAWRESVASIAVGNSRLVFAISAAFAGPLASITGEDSGGFHFRGASSSGKSTVLKLAASVWGNPSKYIRLWRSTLNGLEGLAVQHNDGLLILDEIGQIDQKDAGDAAYLLANGQGKARARRNGHSQPSQRWRLLFLSAGEESLSAVMARAGKTSSAGQEIRLADIEADAGTGMGIFEDLHDLPCAAALASAIKDVCDKYHGTVGREWLNYLAANRRALAAHITDSIKNFLAKVVPSGAEGQVERVARRFALVAVAGELATSYGLTGWDEGEATKAAHRCFIAWLETFGGSGNREQRAILAQVRAFFESHGASRFEDMHTTNDQRIPNRAGFYRNGEDGRREFLVLSEAFRREICQGFDEKTVKKILIEHKLLLPAKDGKPTHVARLPGLGSTRVYVVGYMGQEDIA
jgi:putative DNA primase/helicase